MRDWIFRVSASVVLMAGPLSAQQKPVSWQGMFAADGEKHRAILQMEKADGGWKAGAFYIEFFHDDIHIDSLVVNGANGSALKFTVNGGGGVYEGKMSADGSSIAGTWTYDKHPAELLSLIHI